MNRAIGLFLLVAGIVSQRVSAEEAVKASEPSASIAESSAVLNPFEAPKMLASDATKSNGWHFRMDFSAWLISADGSTSVGDFNTDFSMDFSDLISDAQYCFAPSFEMSNGKWTIAFNGLISKLEDEATGDHGAKITTSIDMDILDLALAYRVLDCPLGNDGARFLLDPSIDLRWTYLNIKIDPKNLESKSKDNNWFDFSVGLRGTIQFNRKVGWRTEGTLGGFGIGDSSSQTWSAGSYLDWQFSDHFGLVLGYRAISWERRNGGLEWDMTLHGPWIGLMLTWD